MAPPITDTHEYVKIIPTPSFEAWLKIGMEAGYCTDVYCSHHQIHANEDREVFHFLYEEHEGNRDFCWPVVRLRTLAEDD